MVFANQLLNSIRNYLNFQLYMYEFEQVVMRNSAGRFHLALLYILYIVGFYLWSSGSTGPKCSVVLDPKWVLYILKASHSISSFKYKILVGHNKLLSQFFDLHFIPNLIKVS